MVNGLKLSNLGESIQDLGFPSSPETFGSLHPRSWLPQPREAKHMKNEDPGEMRGCVLGCGEQEVVHRGPDNTL